MKTKMIARKWQRRIARRAAEHNATPYPKLIELAAHSVALQEKYKPEASKVFRGTDNLPGKITARQYLREQRETVYSLFRKEEDVISEYISYHTESGWSERYWISEAMVLIPYTCQGYEKDAVTVSNYRYLHSEFSDLFAYGLLVDEGSCIALLLDKPYHNYDRLDDLMIQIARLQDNYLFDNQLWSDVMQEWKEETIKNEVENFVNCLEIDSPLFDKLFPMIKEKWNSIIDLDHSIFNEEQLIAHMWKVIRDNEIDFDENGTWIDTKEIVQKSPLYKLGKERAIALDQIEEKLGTVEVSRPDLWSFVASLVNDLHDAREGKAPRLAFYSV